MDYDEAGYPICDCKNEFVVLLGMKRFWFCENCYHVEVVDPDYVFDGRPLPPVAHLPVMCHLCKNYVTRDNLTESRTLWSCECGPMFIYDEKYGETLPVGAGL